MAALSLISVVIAAIPFTESEFAEQPTAQKQQGTIIAMEESEMALD